MTLVRWRKWFIAVTTAFWRKAKSCPTIAANGDIYVTGNSGGVPTLYKIVGTGSQKSVAPGSNWSQLGCNPQKNGCAPGSVF